MSTISPLTGTVLRLSTVLLLTAFAAGCSGGPVRNVAYDPFVSNRSVRIVESGAVAYRGQFHQTDETIVTHDKEILVYDQ